MCHNFARTRGRGTVINVFPLSLSSSPLPLLAFNSHYPLKLASIYALNRPFVTVPFVSLDALYNYRFLPFSHSSPRLLSTSQFARKVRARAKRAELSFSNARVVSLNVRLLEIKWTIVFESAVSDLGSSRRRARSLIVSHASDRKSPTFRARARSSTP